MWVQVLDVAGKSEQEERETDGHCCSDIKSALCTIFMFEKEPISLESMHVLGWAFCLSCTLDLVTRRPRSAFFLTTWKQGLQNWALNTYLAT